MNVATSERKPETLIGKSLHSCITGAADMEARGNRAISIET